MIPYHALLNIGGSYVITDRFEASSIILLIKKYRVSWTHTVLYTADLLTLGSTIWKPSTKSGKQIWEK